MSRDVHGDNSVHPNIASSMSKLGNLYRVEGKHEEALKMYEKYFEMRQTGYGKQCKIRIAQLLLVI